MRRLVLVLLSLIFTASAFAQQMPRLTWLRYYQAAAGKDGDLLWLVNDSLKPVLDKLVADKKALAWGVAVPLTHTGEPWTHIVFVGLADWAAAEELAKAIAPSESRFAAGPVQPGSVRDVILRNIAHSEVPPAAKPKYIGIDTYVVKPGRSGDVDALFNEWTKPLFTAVAAKGKFGPWGFSTQDMRGDYTHMVWYFMSDLTALDEHDAALMAIDPVKLRGYDVRLRDATEPEKHRMQILRVVQ
ncbi:MAG TPA: hypothetical protein VGQ76_16380 [Thermoanaerobaculia bacterium]|jgi:hypothetical protein|nr:hypothetical protein [Thermoanaerobaculia bacterium]